MKRHNCQARQHSDQMICAPCGLTWDINDPEPPECHRNIKRAAEASPVMPHRYGQGRLPDQLPADLASEMVKTYLANGRGVAAMQAAYRLFLDRIEL